VGHVHPPSISYDPANNTWGGALDAIKNSDSDHAFLLVEAIAESIPSTLFTVPER